MEDNPAIFNKSVSSILLEMKNELPIEPIPSENKPKDKRLKKIPFKTLPSLPTNCVILGRVGSGKSSCLYSMLKDGYVNGKKSVFDEMVFYLGNKESAPAFEKIPCKNKAILYNFDPDAFEEYLESLKKHQLERLEKNKPPLNVAIIMDDFAGVSLLKKQKGKSSSPLERLFLTSRHEANCSIFFLSQVLKSAGFTTPTIRNNVMTWIVYSMTKPEIEKMAEDHCQQYSPKEFIQIYNKIMETPYNFLTIDYRRPINERLWERFSNPVENPSYTLSESDVPSSSEGEQSESD